MTSVSPRTKRVVPSDPVGLTPDWTLIEDKPPDAFVGGSHQQRRALLANIEKAAAKPNKWFRIVTYTKKNTAVNTASELRVGKRPMPNGKWEVRQGAVPNDEGKFGVWVKYLG